MIPLIILIQLRHNEMTIRRRIPLSILLTTYICSLWSCLAFKESDLDPNSPFSVLSLLSRLNANSLSISPQPGFYPAPVFIQFFFPSGSRVFYTLDGSVPTTASTEYRMPIHIWKVAGAPIHAKAFQGENEVADLKLTGTYSYPPLRTLSGFSLNANDDGSLGLGLNRNYANITVENDPIVIDTMTGLIWKKCSEELNPQDCSGTLGGLFFNDATNSCQALNEANGGLGYALETNWRLPTYTELLTLLDYQIESSSPAINMISFPNTAQDAYWTKTGVSFDSNLIYRIRFEGNRTINASVGSNQITRCVSEATNSRSVNYINHNNGIVTDTKTGLIWQKCSNDQDPNTCAGNTTLLTLTDAFNYCDGLNLGGRSDWRLPNAFESHSLFDLNASSAPTIDQVNFPNTMIDPYWTSTALNNFTAFLAYYNQASIDSFNIGSNVYNVRCVTGP